MNSDAIKQFFNRLVDRFEHEKEQLGDLDAIVGDGDHGISMANGFSEANNAIKDSDAEDVGQLFQQAGRALMSAIGGASGPLFAMVLLELGKASIDETELTTAALQKAIPNAAAAVQRLGKAQANDKTMLDVLLPVGEAIQEEDTLESALVIAAKTASAAAIKTAELAAKKGRGQYVQGGGLGHPDPGCVSLSIVFETLYKTHQEVNA